MPSKPGADVRQVAPALLIRRRVEDVVGAPDAAQISGREIPELEAGHSGKLGRQRRDEHRPVALGRDLDGLIALLQDYSHPLSHTGSLQASTDRSQKGSVANSHSQQQQKQQQSTLTPVQKVRRHS